MRVAGAITLVGIMFVAFFGAQASDAPDLRREAELAAALHFVPMLPGRVKSCAPFRPKKWLTFWSAGVSRLSIHIAADGAVSATGIRTSSGDAAFDQAAIACANAFFMQPAMWNGQPVAVDWEGRIDWHHDEPVLGIALQNMDPTQCYHYSRHAREAGARGISAVTFRVDADGRANDVGLAMSSGFGDLDHVAAACFAHQYFYPPTRDGQPVAIEWRGIVQFGRP